MTNTTVNPDIIRSLFRARSISSALTDRDRRAATSAADSEDVIRTASPEDPLPFRFDYHYLDRNRRRGFDWDNVCYLADHRANVILAHVNTDCGTQVDDRRAVS